MRLVFFYIQKCRMDGLLLSFRGTFVFGVFYITLPAFFKIKSNEKKVFYVGVLCLWATKSLAQLNVQLHYDLGHGMYGNEISSRQHSDSNR